MSEISFSKYSGLILHHNIDLIRREIAIDGDITDRRARKFDKQMKVLESQEGEITVTVNTYGGSIHACFAIIDRIRASGCVVNTVGTGVVMSAGLSILAAGENRKATKYCTFMHHGLSGESGFTNIPNQEAALKGSKELDRVRFRHLAERTSKPYSFWASTGKHVDHSFNSEQAKEYGLINEIV